MEVRWTKQAGEDMESLHAYLQSHAGDAVARRTSRLVFGAIANIGLYPYSAPEHPERPSTRQLVVVGTPFKVMYSIDGNAAHIVTIVHHALRWPV